MASTIAIFVSANAAASRGFDRVVLFPPRQVGSLFPNDLRTLFMESHRVADVGGGKKPFALYAGLDASSKEYVGLDLDGDELALAPAGSYSATRVFDVCTPDPDPSLAGQFDLVICRSTLEHVVDTDAAVLGLSRLLAPGGRCYLRLPCRRAVFAQLNLLLPQHTKRLLLHAIFPHKHGDGFAVHYDRCIPSAIVTLARKYGLDVIAQRRTYRSSYFGAFFPLYLLWRAIATAQYLTDADYCESFELVLRKPTA